MRTEAMELIIFLAKGDLDRAVQALKDYVGGHEQAVPDHGKMAPRLF